MKKINFSGRGGASDCLVYFGIMKELFNKKIKAGRVALTSGATMMFTLWACGYTPRKSKAILKSVKYDFFMRMQNDLELKHSSLKKKAMQAIGVLAVVKTVWSRNITKILEKTVSWDMVKKAGLVDQLLIGFTTREELKKVYSKWTPFIIVMKRLLSNNIKRETCQKAYDNCHMLWAGCDGVYTVNPKTKQFEKYSNDVIPLPIAIKCAIKNPAMNNFKIQLRGKKQRPFDLGIINNHSNMAFINRKDYYQFSCYHTPEREWIEGDNTLSDFIYNQNIPQNEIVLLSHTENGFFDFSDKNIDEEYLHAQETNIFK